MSFKPFAPHIVDSYKTSHHKMYTEGTTLICSNLTPRSDRIFRRTILTNAIEQFYNGKLVHFGLQGLLRDMNEIWYETFFSQPKADVCAKYARRLSTFVGGMEVDVRHFEELHDYGKLPIAVRGLLEGTQVPMGVPAFSFHNTNPVFAWFTNYLETWFSNEYWKVSTIATISLLYRNILKHWAKETGSPMEFVNWQGHDFAYRGMSGFADGKNSIGHLASFFGSDTLVAADYAEWAYDGSEILVSGSVPASEHSVMTLDGQEGEFELFKRLITQVVPTGLVSLVSDGYDYWKVLTEYLPALKNDILARQPDALGFAKVVVRPDSGDPVRIVAGYRWKEFPDLETAKAAMYAEFDGNYGVMETELVIVEGKIYEVDMEYWSDGSLAAISFIESELTMEEVRGSIDVMWEIFGGTTTETGHKLLDSHIGLIYGDSITPDRCNEILSRLAEKGYASANVVFGIGSYTYQYLTRDTFGIAVKATYANVNGEPRNIFKAPKTDSGTKKSARGLLAVRRDDEGELYLEQEADVTNEVDHGELALVWFEGQFTRRQNLDSVRVLIDPTFYG